MISTASTATVARAFAAFVTELEQLGRANAEVVAGLQSRRPADLEARAEQIDLAHLAVSTAALVTESMHATVVATLDGRVNAALLDALGELVDVALYVPELSDAAVHCGVDI